MAIIATLKRHAGFLQNIGTLFTGKIVGFISIFLLTPFIARLFDPADFGIAALFVSICTLLGRVASLHYDHAIVLPKENSRASLLFWLALGSSALVCIVVLLILTVLSLMEVPIPFADQLGVWIWWVPLGAFLLGLVERLQSWLTRTKDFKSIAYSEGVGPLLTGVSRLSLGEAFGSSPWGLIAGQAFGVFAKIILLSRATLKSSSLILKKQSWKDLSGIAWKYKEFPLYNTTAGFIVDFSRNLPILMLGYMFSPAIVGFYAMGSRLAHTPIQAAATSIRRVYLQKIAQIKNKRRPLWDAQVKATIALALTGLVPFGLLWLFGEVFLSLFLGERWSIAGRFVEIIAPWLYAIWITIPSSTVLVVLRKQALWFWIQVGLLPVRLSVFIFAYIMSASPEWTLTAFVLVNVVAHMGIILIAFYLVQLSDSRERTVDDLITGVDPKI